MALIECPECKKQISGLADSCPHCGYSVESEAKHSRVQTIEKTSKQWKQAQLAGVILAVVGIVMAVNGGSTGVLGGFGVFFGILLFIGARLGAWWENG